MWSLCRGEAFHCRSGEPVPASPQYFLPKLPFFWPLSASCLSVGEASSLSCAPSSLLFPFPFYLPSSAVVGIEGGPGRFLGGRARPEELVAGACVELCASSATCVGSGTAWDSQTRHGRRFFLPPSIAVSYEGRGWNDAPAQGTTMPSGTRGGVVSGAKGGHKAWSCRVRSSQCAMDLLTSPFVRLVLERPRFRCLGAAALAVEVPGSGVHVQEPPGWREVAPTRGAVSGAGWDEPQTGRWARESQEMILCPCPAPRLWLPLPRQCFWVLGAGMKTAAAEETPQFVSDREADLGPSCPLAARLSPPQSHVRSSPWREGAVVEQPGTRPLPRRSAGSGLV